MAREYGRLMLSVWNNVEFTALDSTTQWLYFALLSQYGTSTCGVLSYAPNRWATLAPDTKPRRVIAAVEHLEASGFVVVDRETDELAIRSHLRHDRTLRTTNTAKAVARSWALIRSPVIRKAVLIELQRLHDEGEHSEWPGWQVPEIKSLVALDLRTVT